MRRWMPKGADKGEDFPEKIRREARRYFRKGIGNYDADGWTKHHFKAVEVLENKVYFHTLETAPFTMKYYEVRLVKGIAQEPLFCMNDIPRRPVGVMSFSGGC